MKMKIHNFFFEWILPLASHKKFQGFTKSHGKCSFSFDLIALTNCHRKCIGFSKVMENSKDLPKVTENTDLALTWLPLLKVMENALNLKGRTKKVLELYFWTECHFQLSKTEFNLYSWSYWYMWEVKLEVLGHAKQI